MLAAIMVIASFTLLFYMSNASKEYTPGLYLPVTFTNSTGGVNSSSIATVGGYSYMGGYNLSNLSVMVFSDIPDALYANQGASTHIIGINSTANNPYYDELFAGIPNSKGIVMGSINSTFLTILYGYRHFLSIHNERNVQVAMELDASYQFVKGDTVYVYHYFNEIPFFPFDNYTASPYQFHQVITMNMNQAPTMFPLNKANSSLSPDKFIGGGGGCYNVVRSSVSTYWGPLPYYIGVVNHTTLPTDYEMSIGLSLTNISLNFGASSTQSYDESSSGTVLSTNPSWAGAGQEAKTEQISYGATSGKGLTPPDHNIVMIGYGHFEMQDIFSKVYVFNPVGCVYEGTYNTTTLKIVNPNNGSFDLVSGFMSTLYKTNYSLDPLINAFIQHMVRSTPELVNATSYLDNVSYSMASQSYVNDVTARGFNSNGFSWLKVGMAALGVGISIAAIVSAPETAGFSLVGAAYLMSELGLGFSLVPALTTTTYYSATHATNDFVDFSLTNGQSFNVTAYLYVAEGYQTLNGSSYSVPSGFWNVTNWN